MIDDIDADLVCRWLAGDKRATDALVDRHFHDLLVYAKWRRFSGIEPEDAVQNLFVTLIEKIHLWDRRKGTLRGWLITILENGFKSAYRAQEAAGRHLEILADRLGRQRAPQDPSAPCERHHPRWFNRDIVKAITKILEDLRPERAAFLLKPARGFPYDDRAALSRARRKIARKLCLDFGGPKLTVVIARELITTLECGKISKELFR